MHVVVGLIKDLLEYDEFTEKDSYGMTSRTFTEDNLNTPNLSNSHPLGQHKRLLLAGTSIYQGCFC
jgi:hypothetical protein